MRVVLLAAAAALAFTVPASAASPVCARPGTCVAVTADPSGPTVCVQVSQTAIPAVIAPVCVP